MHTRYRVYTYYTHTYIYTLWSLYTRIYYTEKRTKNEGSKNIQQAHREKKQRKKRNSVCCLFKKFASEKFFPAVFVGFVADFFCCSTLRDGPYTPKLVACATTTCMWYHARLLCARCARLRVFTDWERLLIFWVKILHRCLRISSLFPFVLLRRWLAYTTD